jgi:hypothetical protein
MATLRQIRRRIRTVESDVSTPQPQPEADRPPADEAWGIEKLWHAPGFSLGCEDAW